MPDPSPITMNRPTCPDCLTAEERNMGNVIMRNVSPKLILDKFGWEKEQTP